MSKRKEWSAILAGALLLVSGSSLESRLDSALLAVEGGASGAPRSPAPPRDEIATVLLERNPSLGSYAAERIAAAVLRCSAEQGLSPELVLRVMVAESDLRPEARSPKGALGLMQVMPHMFEQLDLPGNPLFIETNIEAGCTILADNIRRLGEDAGILSYYWGSRIRGDGYLHRVRSMLPGLELSSLTASERESH
ncbi:MAG: transglycosylase SLT domain-containing protein [Myxococcota bacterium]